MARPPSTRAQILRSAAAHFRAKGYQRTSLQAIADDLGLTKATILYHFPAKEHIAAELMEPVITDLEELIIRSGQVPIPQDRVWALLEGWVDTLLRHREILSTLRYDIGVFSRQSQYHRVLLVTEQAVAVISGPGADRRDRVRAIQALGMVSDPVVYYLDVDAASLREDVLDGVRRLLGPGALAEPPDTARGTARRTGRPRVLSPDQVRAAAEMYASRSHSVDEIAARFGVSRATLYRHLRQL